MKDCHIPSESELQTAVVAFSLWSYSSHKAPRHCLLGALWLHCCGKWGSAFLSSCIRATLKLYPMEQSTELLLLCLLSPWGEELLVLGPRRWICVHQEAFVQRGVKTSLFSQWCHQSALQMFTCSAAGGFSHGSFFCPRRLQLRKGESLPR